MSTIVGWDTRLDLCDVLLKYRLAQNHLELAIWDKLSAKLRKKYKARHKVAHFTFISSGEREPFKHMIAPFWSFGHLMKQADTYLGIAEIEEMQKSFIQLKDSLSWFTTYLRLQKEQPAAPLPPDAGLIAHFRDLVAQTPAGS
jgi:hypothetical protein